MAAISCPLIHAFAHHQTRANWTEIDHARPRERENRMHACARRMLATHGRWQGPSRGDLQAQPMITLRKKALLASRNQMPAPSTGRDKPGQRPLPASPWATDQSDKAPGVETRRLHLVLAVGQDHRLALGLLDLVEAAENVAFAKRSVSCGAQKWGVGATCRQGSTCNRRAPGSRRRTSWRYRTRSSGSWARPPG